ncbi:hypothetical protein [Lactococcus cremoris]|uniref:Uncharacterized protein n=1 Tax=Lactococcus cremoris subsp. cremoris IBB477 TaxID=1449093 RepID=A0A1E7G380_LACLC|nr:hypothetical protein [Lactococcus cremoris]MBS5601051.1 hypothetical protein [Lactococcus lactis]MCI1841340.1 hypothetical protein [Lactococcus lactis]MCT0445317.1 hypothetical protein [Lactococcus cremoris]MCT0450119.1 hypothetical protein [Lactococcus cremoris]MCT0453402.1 hypothetical protein [Lactococcus cremoris]
MPHREEQEVVLIYKPIYLRRYQTYSQLFLWKVVNKKVNVSRKYFDDTKAMARNYYLNGSCDINGTSGTSVQILGRFNFISQLEKYNNKIYFKNMAKVISEILLITFLLQK